MPRDREQHQHDTLRLEVTHRLDAAQFNELVCLLRHGENQLFQKVDEIGQKVNAIMARSHVMNDLITKLNSATNNLATRIKGLEDRIKNSGMSAEDEAAAIAELGAIGTTLENMGANPNEPLPPPEPTP